MGLFRSPGTLATLRYEAASRFLRWREVERAVERVQWSAATLKTPIVPDTRPSMSDYMEQQHSNTWDKQAWEAQWEGSLSQEFALQLRRRRRSDPPRRLTSLTSFTSAQPSASTVTSSALHVSTRERDDVNTPCAAPFDPLHLPSLFVFSFSLLGALRSRVARSLGIYAAPSPPKRTSPTKAKGAQPKSAGRSFGYTLGLGLALVGAFCAGVGLSMVASTRF